MWFAREDGGWDALGYDELAWSVGEAAAQVEALRERAGGTVAIALPSDHEFVAAFFGTLAAGDTPCPVAPPVGLKSPQDYLTHTAAILRTAEPSLVLTTAALHDLVAEAAGAGRRVAVLELGRERVEPAPRRHGDLALLQFTSGSTGRPRAARISWDNLELNIEMIQRWALRSGAPWATWLPLFHDMGLIGGLLTPVANQTTSMVMRPDQFIRWPERWLECFGRLGGGVTASPTFGFGYAARRVRPEALEGMRFDEWDVAIVAAERIDPGVLGDFAALLGPFGFDAGAYVPAYGLAEATLAVTGGDPDGVAPAARLDWSSLSFGREVAIEEEARVDQPERIGDGAGWLVGSGRAHPTLAVGIVDEDGVPLGERRLGEIVVRGPTVASGYLGGDGTGSTSFEGDLLRTGDAGFLLGDELYVVGRIGDSLKLRGRTVYMEDIEGKLAQVDGVSKGRCVALCGSAEDGEAIVALVEAEPGAWAEAAARVLERACASERCVRVIAAPRGTIARTSSGKPRRRSMWRAMLEGDLAGEVVVERRPAGSPALAGSTR